jgi:CRP/FNR family transcriptional regulator, cyclic AMP receptor protein
VDAQVRHALSRSNLRELPGDVLDELVMGADRVRIPAGSVTHWEGEHAPFLELVISGVVRVFVTAPDGRTMTIRYCRPGALIGARRCSRHRMRCRRRPRRWWTWSC